MGFDVRSEGPNWVGLHVGPGPKAVLKLCWYDGLGPDQVRTGEAPRDLDDRWAQPGNHYGCAGTHSSPKSLIMDNKLVSSPATWASRKASVRPTGQFVHAASVEVDSCELDARRYDAVTRILEATGFACQPRALSRSLSCRATRGHPKSTSWPESQAWFCSIVGVGGMANRSRTAANATSRPTASKRTDQQPSEPARACWVRDEATT